VAERLAKRLWEEFDDFRGVVGVGEHPGDKTLDGAVGDVLYAYSRRMEVGTRVDLFGHQTPELIHAVLAALAEAPPWMRGPVWD
jgi:hypothetical protein